MLRIPAQQLIGLVGKTARVFRKLAIAVPESPIGAMRHRSVQRPALRSSRASSASASRRPAATSSSIRRSHSAASNSANHVRNAASSAAESPRTASSISFALLIISSLLRTAVHAQPYSSSPVRSGRIDPAGATPGGSPATRKQSTAPGPSSGIVSPSPRSSPGRGPERPTPVVKQCVDRPVSTRRACSLFPGPLGNASVAVLHTVIQVRVRNGAERFVVKARQAKPLPQIFLEGVNGAQILRERGTPPSFGRL